MVCNILQTLDHYVGHTYIFGCCSLSLFPYRFIYYLKRLKLWDKSCSTMSRNDTTTPLSAIMKPIQWLPCIIWPDMLNTHTTELIWFTFYAHVSYAMLVLSFCQRLLTNSMKLDSIDIYMYAFSLWISCDISMYIDTITWYILYIYIYLPLFSQTS
jgi:hypothetical protein